VLVLLSVVLLPSFSLGKFKLLTARRVVSSFNGIACKLLTFTNDVINGENITTLPRWVGIQGIIDKLDETSIELDKIAENADRAFTNTEWTQTEPPKFVARLKDIYTGYKDKDLNNPNPATSLKGTVQKIQPIYVTRLGDHETENTALNTIYKDFNVTINASIDFIEEAQTSARDIKDNIGPIKEGIKEIQDNLRGLIAPIDKINTTYIVPAFDTVKI
jgi:hypothetical protein